MKKITFLLLVLATLFVSCENESINSEVFNEDTNTTDTEDNTEDEDDTIGNQ